MKIVVLPEDELLPNSLDESSELVLLEPTQDMIDDIIDKYPHGLKIGLLKIYYSGKEKLILKSKIKKYPINDIFFFTNETSGEIILEDFVWGTGFVSNVRDDIDILDCVFDVDDGSRKQICVFKKFEHPFISVKYILEDKKNLTEIFDVYFNHEDVLKISKNLKTYIELPSQFNTVYNLLFETEEAKNLFENLILSGEVEIKGEFKINSICRSLNFIQDRVDKKYNISNSKFNGFHYTEDFSYSFWTIIDKFENKSEPFKIFVSNYIFNEMLWGSERTDNYQIINAETREIIDTTKPYKRLPESIFNILKKTPYTYHRYYDLISFDFYDYTKDPTYEWDVKNIMAKTYLNQEEKEEQIKRRQTGGSYNSYKRNYAREIFDSIKSQISEQENLYKEAREKILTSPSLDETRRLKTQEKTSQVEIAKLKNRLFEIYKYKNIDSDILNQLPLLDIQNLTEPKIYRKPNGSFYAKINDITIDLEKTEFVFDANTGKEVTSDMLTPTTHTFSFSLDEYLPYKLLNDLTSDSGSLQRLAHAYGYNPNKKLFIRESFFTTLGIDSLTFDYNQPEIDVFYEISSRSYEARQPQLKLNIMISNNLKIIIDGKRTYWTKNIDINKTNPELFIEIESKLYKHPNETFKRFDEQLHVNFDGQMFIKTNSFFVNKKNSFDFSSIKSNFFCPEYPELNGKNYIIIDEASEMIQVKTPEENTKLEDIVFVLETSCNHIYIDIDVDNFYIFSKRKNERNNYHTAINKNLNPLIKDFKEVFFNNLLHNEAKEPHIDLTGLKQKKNNFYYYKKDESNFEKIQLYSSFSSKPKKIKEFVDIELVFEEGAEYPKVKISEKEKYKFSEDDEFCYLTINKTYKYTNYDSYHILPEDLFNRIKNSTLDNLSIPHKVDGDVIYIGYIYNECPISENTSIQRGENLIVEGCFLWSKNCENAHLRNISILGEPQNYKHLKNLKGVNLDTQILKDFEVRDRNHYIIRPFKFGNIERFFSNPAIRRLAYAGKPSDFVENVCSCVHPFKFVDFEEGSLCFNKNIDDYKSSSDGYLRLMFDGEKMSFIMNKDFYQIYLLNRISSKFPKDYYYGEPIKKEQLSDLKIIQDSKTVGILKADGENSLNIDLHFKNYFLDFAENKGNHDVKICFKDEYFGELLGIRGSYEQKTKDFSQFKIKTKWGYSELNHSYWMFREKFPKNITFKFQNTEYGINEVSLRRVAKSIEDINQSIKKGLLICIDGKYRDLIKLTKDYRGDISVKFSDKKYRIYDEIKNI